MQKDYVQCVVRKFYLKKPRNNTNRVLDETPASIKAIYWLLYNQNQTDWCVTWQQRKAKEILYTYCYKSILSRKFLCRGHDLYTLSVEAFGLLITTDFKVLAALDGVHVTGLAVLARETQHNLLCGLSLQVFFGGGCCELVNYWMCCDHS